MSWRPSCDIAIAGLRARMLARARKFFAGREVLEVDTPALGRFAASDPQIDGHAVMTATGHELYLQTSPEAYMKRLLAAGFPDIYSICHVYRDGEAGRRHQPEFTMIEWYRLDHGLDAIIADTVALVAAVLDRPELEQRVDDYEYDAAFERFAGVDPGTAFAHELAAAADAGAGLGAALGDDRDAWLDLLMTTRVAGGFCRDRLTVLRHYPLSQAALARRCPVDPSHADRFEVFFGDIELANGYVELRDAAEQRRRIETDRDKRRLAGRRRAPADEHLLAALEAGLPDCAGVAAGFDRLLMIAAGKDDIRDVVTFAYEEPGDA